MLQRVHVFLAHAGVASRRKAEDLIKEGKVQINGQVAKIGQPVDPVKDDIKVEGRTITAPGTDFIYLLVNKPRNVVTTTSDELNRDTILSLLPANLRKERIYPVGRLDVDSEGLVLLTNDGDLAFRATHPRYHLPKTYWTQLDHEPTSAAISHLKSGVKLTDGWAKPGSVHPVPPDDTSEDGIWWSITISEGRQHQVKRMWLRTGYEVVRLIRVAFGTLTLDSLEGKPYRELTTAEITELRQSLGL